MDAISKPKNIVSRIKELGQTAIAITDHGTTSGLIETYKECQKQGVKMVFGCEHYYTSDVTIKERGYSHINFWASTQEGYHNLLKLTSEAHKNFYYKPRIDMDLIKKYNKGLLMSSACLGGWLRGNNNEVRIDLLEQFLDIFGDRLYIEVHTYSAPEQKEWNKIIIPVAEKYGIPIVAAVDSHYVCKEDAYTHKMWLTQGKEREDAYYQTADFYLHSEQEMLQALNYLPNAQEYIDNTQKLADRCNIEIEFGGQHYPSVNVGDEEEAVREIVRGNWRNKVPKGKWQEYGERINEEIPVLKKADYLSYFLIVHDFINYCRKAGIPLGFSRGSVGGCETAYVMDLIQTDAIKYDLNFARFCHLERVTVADIDIDVSQKRRGECIEYLKQKYGEDRIFKARTYGYMKAKGALRRAGNCLGYEPKEVDGWCKGIPEFTDDDFKGNEHEEYLIDQTEAPQNLKDLAKSFVGILQNNGMHASAILIFPDEPENYTAIERGKDCMVCAYEFHTLEDIGCLKLDVLGVKTTDVIADTLNLIGKDIDVANLPLEDKKTFDMLCAGKTNGVFQVEGNGFTRLVTEVKPRKFDELAPLLAVYRPGIIGAGLLDTYIKRAKGDEEASYLIPELEPILKGTHGIIVFQEQIIEIAKVICGYTAGQADMLRRAVGRKKPEEMERIKPDFIARAVELGQTEEKARALFELIEFFASYGFNKCVSGRQKLFRNVHSKDNPFIPTIGEMYKIRNDIEYAKKTGHKDLYKKYRSHGYGYALSMCDDGRLRKNKIIDITYSGTLPVYVVETNNGREIRCTMNHKIPTPNGIKLLSELSIGDELYCKGEYDKTKKKYNFGTSGANNFPQKGQCGFQYNPTGGYTMFELHRKIMLSQNEPCEKCGCPYDRSKRFELHHVDKDRTNNDSSNLVWLCNSCHKKVHYEIGRTKQYQKGVPTITDKIKSITYECTEDCYDVEMKAPYHNFVVESGIVVCNSHAYGYGMLSYATAYLKANYPKEFMVSLINSESNQEDTLPYIAECRRMNINVLPPHIQHSSTEWTIEGDSIRMGLTYIKGIGSNIDLSDTSTFDVVAKQNNKRIVSALIKAGAMDCFGKRNELLRSICCGELDDLQSKQGDDMKRLAELEDKLRNTSEKLKKYANIKQQISNTKARITKRKSKIEEAEHNEKQIVTADNAMGEMEVLGMSFSNLPRIIKGEVVAVREIVDKNNHKMAFVTFGSDYGKQEGTVFWKQWKAWKGILQQGTAVEYIINNKILKDVRKA